MSGTADCDAVRHERAPEPVTRYLQRAPPDPPRRIESATLVQRGELRTSPRSRRWLAFSARHQVSTDPPGFAWEARVALPLGLRLQVTDEYTAGTGAGTVSLIGLPLSRDRARPELNEGALHRYLAEAPWYPTALLPGPGLSWAPISEHAALATLNDHDLTVSLEFRFDENGDVSGIFTPGRWGRFDGQYRRAAWEGHFSRYEVHAGMRVPGRGEVGWYESQRWEPVFRGEIVAAEYGFSDA